MVLRIQLGTIVESHNVCVQSVIFASFDHSKEERLNDYVNMLDVSKNGHIL